MNLDVNEIVAMLKRTNLTSLVVEGKDDVVVWNQVELLLQDQRVSIVPTGGRDKLLQVFKEMQGVNTNKPIIYIADPDDWLIFGVPNIYNSENLFFTEGYSIENDMIYDGNLLRLINGSTQRYLKDIDYLAEYYALYITKKMTNFTLTSLKLHIADHVNKILSSNSVEWVKTHIPDMIEFSQPIIDIINIDPYMHLRGKSILQIICNYSPPGYNQKTLLGMAAIQHGRKMQNIVDKIRFRIQNIVY